MRPAAAWLSLLLLVSVALVKTILTKTIFERLPTAVAYSLLSGLVTSLLLLQESGKRGSLVEDPGALALQRAQRVVSCAAHRYSLYLCASHVYSVRCRRIKSGCPRRSTRRMCRERRHGGGQPTR